MLRLSCIRLQLHMLCSLFILNAIILLLLIISQIICDCGFPGLPIDSRLDSAKLFYAENETVVYNCKNYPNYYKQFRRQCVDNWWTGPTPRCGSKVQTELKYIALYSQNGTVAESKDSFAKVESNVSLTDVTFKLTKTNHTQHNFITIELIMKNKIIVDMMEIWLELEDVKNEVNFISTHVDQRKCYLDHQLVINLTLISFIACDLIDKIGNNQTTNNITMRISIESLNSLTIKNFTIYKLTNSCGQIEIPHNKTGVELLAYNGSHYLVNCSQKRNFYPFDDFLANNSRYISCGSDSRWLGTFPKCVSLDPCGPIESALNLLVVYKTSLENKSNNSKHIAFHSCINTNESLYELIGDTRRQCIDGQWSGEAPVCRQIFSFIESTKVNVPMLEPSKFNYKIVIHVMSIIFGFVSVSIIILFFCVRRKNKRKNQRKNIDKNKLKSELYADIVNNNSSANLNHYTSPRVSLNYAAIEVEKCNSDDLNNDLSDNYEIINCDYENFEIIANHQQSSQENSPPTDPIYTVII